MILKYRTTSLSSPPHTSYSYIDNISHFSPIYNPLTSTLTVNLTLRTPYPIPTSLILNDLAFLLTDDGRFLDKVFDPNSQSNNQKSNSFYYQNNQNNQSQQKPYRPYNKHYYKKPYYKSNSSTGSRFEKDKEIDIESDNTTIE